MHRRGAGGVGLGGLHAAPAGTGTPGDQRLGIGRYALEFFHKGFATGEAVHAVLIERRVAFHGYDVIAFVVLDQVVKNGLGLMPGSRHDGVVVIQRDQRQDGVLGQRVGRADEGLGTAGAFQAVQPDHRHTRFGFQCIGNARDKSRAQAQRGGGQAAELQEAASGHALATHGLIESLHVVTLLHAMQMAFDVF